MLDDEGVLREDEILTLCQLAYPISFSWPWPQVHDALPPDTLVLIDKGLIDLDEHGRTPQGIRLVRLTLSDTGRVLLRLLGRL